MKHILLQDDVASQKRVRKFYVLAINRQPCANLAPTNTDSNLKIKNNKKASNHTQKRDIYKIGNRSHALTQLSPDVR